MSDVIDQVRNKDEINENRTKEEYTKKIDYLKNEIINYLKDNVNIYKQKNIDLNEQYIEYSNNLIDFIEKQLKFIEKFCLNEDSEKRQYKLIIDSLEKIIILNKMVSNNIEAFKLLISNPKNFNKKYIIEDFLEKEPNFIRDNNISFQQNENELQYKYIQNKELKNYIKNNFNISFIHINGHKDYEENINICDKNTSYLRSLRLENLEENDIMNILEKKFDKCVKLYINKCKVTNFNLGKNFLNLNALIFKNYILKIENLNLPNIQILNLDKIGLTDLTFNNIILGFSQINSNLRKISVMNNNITNLNSDSKVLSFLKKLDELDLENNRIFEINENIIGKGGIKFCNLVQNNFSFIHEFNIEEKLKELDKDLNYFSVIILSKNLFLMRKEDRDLYILYLIKILERCNYHFKKICFDYLFDKTNLFLLKQINLNPFQYSLKKLDLSHCCLNDNILFELLSTNMILINLKELKICSNEITHKFFGDFIHKNFNEIFPRLEKIDFSENNINFYEKEDLLSLIDFIKMNYELKILIFKNTCFESEICNYLKKEINIFYNERRNQIKNLNNKITLKSNEIEIKNFILNINQKKDFKIHISKLFQEKYYLKIEQHLKSLINNIYLE